MPAHDRTLARCRQQQNFDVEIISIIRISVRGQDENGSLGHDGFGVRYVLDRFDTVLCLGDLDMTDS